MKTFEITHPALKIASDAAIAVISGRQSGAMEKDEARDIIAGANAITRSVGQELQVRLAMPKIAAMEAKMIEAEQQPKIAAA